MLVEIDHCLDINQQYEHVLDITQKYETPEFFISTCQTDLHSLRKDKKLKQILEKTSAYLLHNRSEKINLGFD